MRAGSVTGRSTAPPIQAQHNLSQIGGANPNANVRAKLLALDDMVEILGGELGFHKREVQMLRSEKESLESVLTAKTGEVRKTLTHELKKVEDEMKRHYAWQKSENSRIQQQVTGLKQEKTSLDMQLMELERRMAELELQMGHDAQHM